MATAREQLAQFAAGSKALGRLCREYKNRSATVHLEELVGGALSFYAAAAVAESGGVHGFVAEDFMSFMHKVCGIHAAGERQHDAAELLQVCFQIVLFLL